MRLSKISSIIMTVIDDLHEVRPEYLVKLKKIDEGKFISRAELERELEFISDSGAITNRR